MITRPYGTTGQDVSVIGMGGMRFKERDDFHKSSRMLVRALEGGINYFDTAEGYGPSEEIFGEAIPDMKRSGLPFHIATKTFAAESSEVRLCCERSLRRLKLDVIDFYHVWCVVRYEQLAEREAQGCFDTFLKLKDEGKIKHICLSTHMSGPDIARALEEYPFFEGVLLGFNGANFPYRIDGVQAASAAGKGVVTMNPLGGGAIVDHPDRFGYLQLAGDDSLVRSAIRFNVSHAEVTVALVGLRTMEDVEDVLTIGDTLELLDKEDLDRIKASAGEGIEGLCTSCNYCKECPADIPVMKFMEACNEVFLQDENKAKAAMGRLKYHWGIDDLAALEHCLDCKTCEEACTQKLPITERFGALKKLYEEAKGA